MPDNEIFDITIIGAGPTGLFASFYSGLREMSTKLIEALPEPGGQLSVLYPEKLIYDVPGHPKILAQDLVKQLLAQCALFEPTFVYEQRIDTLTRVTSGGEEVWRLGTATEAHLSRTVLITAGIGAFAPMKIDRPGISDYEGKGVFYFVTYPQTICSLVGMAIPPGDTLYQAAVNQMIATLQLVKP